MRKVEREAINRRDFLRDCSMLVAGGTLAAAGALHAQDERAAGKTIICPRLWEPFDDGERAAYERSKLAEGDVPAMVREGYYCGEILLLRVLERLNKPREWVAVAAGIRDGFGKRDRCCLLTGGVMALGLVAGEKHEIQRERSAYALELVDRYWAWWQERAPLNCGEIRPNCMGEGYPRMVGRVAVRIEEMIESELG